ncbi:MAG: hypothetical protein IJ157_04975 [Clostridia bacterium]|nr:hypothetical protein [Clostridia bacterium]
MVNYDSGGSYILLSDALANGARILTRVSIDDIRVNRQHGPSMENLKRVKHKRSYGYGLGERTLMKLETSRSPVGEFGWGDDGSGERHPGVLHPACGQYEPRLL